MWLRTSWLLCGERTDVIVRQSMRGQNRSVRAPGWRIAAQLHPASLLRRPQACPAAPCGTTPLRRTAPPARRLSLRSATAAALDRALLQQEPRRGSGGDSGRLLRSDCGFRIHAEPRQLSRHNRSVSCTRC